MVIYISTKTLNVIIFLLHNYLPKAKHTSSIQGLIFLTDQLWTSILETMMASVEKGEWWLIMIGVKSILLKTTIWKSIAKNITLITTVNITYYDQSNITFIWVYHRHHFYYTLIIIDHINSFENWYFPDYLHPKWITLGKP